MPIRPVSPAALVNLVVERAIAARTGDWSRVLVDGAPAAAPERWAERVVEGLAALGRPVVHVRAEDFLRPASLRFEHGRTDPDAFSTNWLDESGLCRTVLAPLGPGGDGRIVTSLWDSQRDRATRAPFVPVPPGGVCLVSGSLLLGGLLPAELTVHLVMSSAVLEHRTDPGLRWTLPAFARYEQEVAPAGWADVVAKVDHPDRPALLRDADLE